MGRRTIPADLSEARTYYWNRVPALAFPASFRFRAIRADGSTFDAETDMIPLTFGGHTVAYHFVRQVGA